MRRVHFNLFDHDGFSAGVDLEGAPSWAWKACEHCGEPPNHPWHGVITVDDLCAAAGRRLYGVAPPS